MANGDALVERLKSVGRMLMIVVLALATQFLLGMVVNLFIEIPATHPGAGVSDFFVGAGQSIEWALTAKWPYLALHVLLGLGLVVASWTFLIRGLLAPRKTAVVAWNGVGALAALFAALNGIYFVIHPTNDVASMQMAGGFAVAISAVAVQLLLVGRAGMARPN